MLKSILVSVAVIAAFVFPSSANLVDNGDFKRPISSGWRGGNFGGGEGSVAIVRDGTGTCARLEKRLGPGGAQLMSGGVSLKGVRRFVLSLRYRTSGARLYARYGRHVGGKWQPLTGMDGKGLLAKVEGFVADGQWHEFRQTCDVPEGAMKHDPFLRLQFQVWAKMDVCSYLEIADVCIEPVAMSEQPSVVSAPQSVTVSVIRSPMEEGYGPVAPLMRHEFKIKDGLFYRNGKPFFYVGWGCDTGGGQATPTGLWLAYLQGIRFIGTYHQPGISPRENTSGDWDVVVKRVPGWVSWSREANRMGMLNEPHPLIKWRKDSEMDKLGKLSPEVAEAYFNLGHYLSYDAGTQLGRDILAEARRQYFGYTWPNCPANYCEIAREPGPSRMNNRMREAFRDYVRQKYDGDLALVNRVWKTNFASWDAVEPLHLKTSLLAESSAALSLRKAVFEKHPEHYYDCLRFMQLDTALRSRNEFADVKREVPGIPVTVDIRGHHSYADNYCAYDPELIAPYEDILHVHKGYPAYTYRQTPWHEGTLLDQTAYPLFNYAYFTRNTKLPVVNCEDIVTKSQVPGSNLEAMTKGDFAQLHKRPWKFRLERSGEDGLTAGWYKRDFDDNAWGEVPVPGAWDEQPEYSGKDGVGWYRTRFVLDGRLKADYLDASRKFLVYGKGVAQSGTLWLNGEKVGELPRGSWDRKYSFDVGSVLNYGGENEIVWRVDGKNGWQNGLRFYCHVLCEDMLNEETVYAEKEYAAQFWTYLMRGSSGVLVWNWNRSEKLKPYLPKIIKPLEIAAEVALPALRSRRSRIAYLYGYLSGRGLPVPNEKRHAITLTWYDALEMTGHRPDVVSEKTFVEEVTPENYPFLVVPESTLVSDETYRHFKEYVAKGGRAILSPLALRKTFSRYEPTDVDSLSGQVTVWPAESSLAELMDRFDKVLPRPEIIVSSSKKDERPLIERTLVGNDSQKVLYLFNWGGFDHPLAVDIPPEYGSWGLTGLRGTFARDANGRISVLVPSQSPVACLLTKGEKDGSVDTRLSPDEEKTWDRIVALNSKKPDSSRPKALWAREKHLFPYVLDRLNALGYDSVEIPPEEWTDDVLANYALIVITETSSFAYKKALKSKAFASAVRRRVEAGASLLVMVSNAWTSNAYGNCLRAVAGGYGVTAPWKGQLAKDMSRATFGDAWQITTDDVLAGSPLTEGVRSVSLYALAPMVPAKAGEAVAVVKIPSTAQQQPGGIAMAAATCGKGRVFISADTMFCQPFRIGEADNAALLQNIVGWLARKPVTAAQREDFRKDLFVEKVGGFK